MGEKIKRIFGIDLGTTNSSIAYVDNYGKAVIINNSDNQPVTPSVVFFDGSEVIIGEVAKENSILYPNQVVSFIKRAMGEPDFLFEYNGNTYRAEEISAFIIKKIVQDAEKNLNAKISDVVITCPAYFGINEREATQKAGEIAGYKVRHILNEPTAAAIAYGSVESAERRVVLVYDLGGGTFDITMIDIQPNAIEVVCTGGDHNLGGKDWDDRIVSYLAEEFIAQTGMNVDILDDPDTCQDLMLSAEKAKKILSQRQKTPIAITFGGERIKVELTKEKFEEVTNALLERTIAFTKEMLDEARKKGYEIFDEIILVGGATRMPQVAARIEKEFSMVPRVFDPDEAVAKGAAIFGAKLALNDELIRRISKKTGKAIDPRTDTADLGKAIGKGSEEIIEVTFGEIVDDAGYKLPALDGAIVTIKDVASKSFGVVVKNSGQEEQVFNLIKKNTSVPTKITRKFFTGVKDQQTVLIRIMENEVSEQIVPLGKAVEIGTAVLNLPNGLPIDSSVNLFFDMSKDGRLKITAVEETEGRTVDAEIDTKSVIQGRELDDAKERCQSLYVH